MKRKNRNSLASGWEGPWKTLQGIKDQFPPFILNPKNKISHLKYVGGVKISHFKYFQIKIESVGWGRVSIRSTYEVSIRILFSVLYESHKEVKSFLEPVEDRIFYIKQWYQVSCLEERGIRVTLYSELCEMNLWWAIHCPWRCWGQICGVKVKIFYLFIFLGGSKFDRIIDWAMLWSYENLINFFGIIAG